MKQKRRVSLFLQVALFALTAGMLIYFCISGNNLVLLLHSLPDDGPVFQRHYSFWSYGPAHAVFEAYPPGDSFRKGGFRFGAEISGVSDGDYLLLCCRAAFAQRLFQP